MENIVYWKVLNENYFRSLHAPERSPEKFDKFKKLFF